MIELTVDNMRGTRGTYSIKPIRNRRGEVTHFRATLDAVRNERGLVAGPYIDCTVQPVHAHNCRVYSRRYQYTCNCGAREMFRKLVNEAGEAEVKETK